MAASHQQAVTATQRPGFHGTLKQPVLFERETYVYPNHQQACTLWYHDHAMALTRLNVYAGLAGFYLISDAFEKSLELPKDDYDIPLMIMDRTFQEDGSLFYPSRPNDTPEDSDIPDPSIVPFFVEKRS